jgi:hypothetical protein
MAWLKDLKRAIDRFGEVETPRAERHPAHGLEAQYGAPTPNLPAGIKDISSSGIYLFTEKRLSTGELVTLLFKEEGQPENSTDLQFSVHARVARQGEDGLGLSYVLPAGLNMDLWGVLMRNIVSLTDQRQIDDMFRTLHTILFLCRLCGAEAEEAILLLGMDLHPDRTATLLKIVHTAENLLASQPGAERMSAHPKLVANILRDGSWAPDEPTMQLWAGLLVSSCSAETPGNSNQVLVDLLVHLTPTQSKIFILGCERTLSSAPGSDNSAPASIVISPKEMIDTTGEHDMTRAATDVAYLFNLGLIRKVCNFSSYQEFDSFDITPSDLGIVLYKHCHGSREKLDPQLVEKANAHLANFIPAPQSIALDDEKHPLPIYRAES